MPSIRHIDKGKIMTETKKINEVIEYVPIDNIRDLNDTFYATVIGTLTKNWKDIKEQPRNVE